MLGMPLPEILDLLASCGYPETPRPLHPHRLQNLHHPFSNEDGKGAGTKGHSCSCLPATLGALASPSQGPKPYSGNMVRAARTTTLCR